MSSDQCCLFWEVCDRFRYQDLESSQHILDEVSVVNLLDVWHNELCELRFLSNQRVLLLKNEEEAREEEKSKSMILYNSGRDKMLASLFKAHELMESRIKPLRVPFGEIHVLNRTLESIASCYVDVASFLRTNEATELSHQDRSAVRGVRAWCSSVLLARAFSQFALSQITNKFLLEQTQVLHSLRETVRVMAIIEPYIPNRWIEASFLSVSRCPLIGRVGCVFDVGRLIVL